ncbi:MAG: Molybdopterin synthase catalytic subunit [Alphaproteobacteria bacterium MarineAlpha5_Bin9]|nr:MAG: Molybdopterin synthase catalytic subunit [Alphaproteobacteria bacterium MarineAlpha5_Bin9]|tara:strand:+ start:4320 stop:4724 length:405 start_codon:yes stop_codon:yes gene_type:complete
MIKIQKKDFNIDIEIKKIKLNYSNIGATSIFLGNVRNVNENQKVKFIELEVYKDMAIKTLDTICLKAKKKWNLIDTLIIHRYGKLNINDKIVLVAVFSSHRKDSFEACNYIMNYLKKDAPFWKKEYYNKKYKWL